MPKQNEFIQHIAWKMTEIPESLRYVQALQISDKFRQSIARLKRDPTHNEPAVRSLYNALPPLAPEILQFFPGTFTNNPQYNYWFTAGIKQEINLESFLDGLRAWVLACYGQQGNQAAQSQDWTTDDFQWTTLDLKDCDDDIRKRILPPLLSRYLCRDQEYEFILHDEDDNETRREHMLISVNPRAQSGAELISWPPREYNHRGNNNSYYSYYQRIWFDYMPGHTELFLYSRSGVRRWHTTSLKNRGRYLIKHNRGKSVYLYRKHSWMTDSKSQSFLVPITLKRFGNDVYFIGKQPDVLEYLHDDLQLPSAENLILDPLTQFPDMVVVHDDVTLENKHKIGKGVEMNDHRDTFNTLEKVLPVEFVPVPKWENIYGGQNYRRISKNLNSDGGKSATDNDKLTGLKAIGQDILIEIHSETPMEVRKCVLAAFGLLENHLSKISESQINIDVSDNQKLLIKPFAHPELIENLPHYSMESDEASVAAEEQRIKDIVKKLKKTKQRTGTLIEMPNKKGDRDDPYNAVSQGLKLTGRVKQNITPKGDSQKGYEQRLDMAVKDLLRQFDFRYQPLYDKSFNTSDLPDHIDLLAMCRIQVNATKKSQKTVQVPIITYAVSGENALHVCVPTSKGAIKWHDNLTDGLLEAATLDIEWDANVCRIFFKNAIEGLVLKNPTLLILSDQNMRQIFSELEGNQAHNQFISLDGILSQKPNIRLARIRLSAQDEAPMSVADKPKSKYQGLYANKSYPNTYTSIYSLSTIKPGTNWTQVNRETKESRIVSTVLISLYNLSPEDKPEAWSWLVHSLRDGSAHTEIPTRLPEPLHSAYQFKEYIFNATISLDTDIEVED